MQCGKRKYGGPTRTNPAAIKLTRVERMIQGLNDGSTKQFTVKVIRGKGRSVFCCSDVISKNSFIMEYDGDLLSLKEAKTKELVYKANGEGCFMFFFRYMEKPCIIDATRKFDRYSRLINHSVNPNCKVHSPIATDPTLKTPRLAIYALRDIYRGEEITIDYGVRRKSIDWLNHKGGDFLSETILNNDDNITLAEESLESSLEVLGRLENQPMVELSFITFEPACDGCWDGESESISGTQEPQTVAEVNNEEEGSASEMGHVGTDTRKDSHEKCYINVLAQQMKMTLADLKGLWSMFGSLADESQEFSDGYMAKQFEEHGAFLYWFLNKGNSVNQLRWLVYELLHHKLDTALLLKLDHNAPSS